MTLTTDVRTETASSLVSLRGWLSAVEDLGELRTIDAEVDPIEEMSAVAYLASKRENAPALLFTNVRGAAPGVHSLFNLTGSSYRRVALSLGLRYQEPLAMIQELRSRISARIPPAVVPAAGAPVNEVVLTGDQVDLAAFAPPRHWPFDGGRYIGTADVVVTRDPELGSLNVGTYRIMVHDRNHVGICISPGKGADLHIKRAWKHGQALPVVAVVGLHPLWLVLGGQAFPKGVSEYDAIGGMLGAPLEVVETENSDLLIPAHAEIVLEGVIEPGALQMEGPFGEFTGYYGSPGDLAPVMSVTTVRHRTNPILTNALMAEYPSIETALFGALARSAKLWDDFDRVGIPGIHGVWAVPAAANGKGMVVISLDQRYPGHVAQVLAFAAAAPSTAYFTKWIVAVDEDIEPSNMNEVLSAMSTRFSPVDDLDILRNTWSTILDPTLNPPEIRPWGSKVLVNACKTHRYLETFPKRMAMNRAVWERVAARWSELGFPGDAPEPLTFADPP